MVNMRGLDEVPGSRIHISTTVGNISGVNQPMEEWKILSLSLIPPLLL